MKLRRRAQALLGLTLGACLIALAALAGALLQGVAGQELPGLAPESLQSLQARIETAEGALWLASAAILALGLAVGLAGLHAWLVGPVERLVRDAAADPEVPRDSAGDEFEQVADALAQYRRRLARDRNELQSQLGAVHRMRGAADEALERLEQTERLALVGRVAMGVAHEVGGPLAVLTGWLERLRALQTQGAPLADQARCVDEAEQAAWRIQTILGDLSQPGLLRTRDEDRPADLVAIGLRVVGQAEQHPRCRGLTLELDAEAAAHPVDASASHVEQVALNLVLNAADAVRRRGRVRLEVARDGAFQVLTVDDDGPGVPADLRDAIFEPFFTTKDQAGWGLGLAVSRRIAAGYGGDLQVDASPLGGARFRLRLPVAR